MNCKRSLIALMVLCIGLAMVPVASAIGFPPGSTVPSEPPVMITKLDGTTVGLDTLFKEPGALVFFNTTCNNCLQEIKWLYKDHPGSNIHLVSIDIGGKDMVERWMKVYMKKMEGAMVYVDPDFAIASKFGVSFTPATVLFEKGALVRQVISGYSPDSHSAIEDILK
ncbi:MAG: TlpA disulfide reductase family protein [bacterium]|nr:TlpA disulfide reductase family protein [bacterium]